MKFKKLGIVFVAVAFTAMAAASGTTETKDVASSESGDNVAVAEESTVSTDVTIEEQVLFEQDDIKVTATEYVTDSILGDGIKLLIENNSDTDVTVGCKALIVNNYMITDLFGAEVAAGKKANETMYLSSAELEAAGIDTVGQVECYFNVYDTESWEDIFNTDCVTIKTSEFDNMDTTPDDAGTELYNENGIRIVGKTVDENSFWGTAVLLYCENNSGKNVTISAEDVSVNGFMIDAYMSSTIYDGKMAIDDITIFSSDLEDNGIESIEDVELKFEIYDEETYETIDTSDVITFSAE